MNKIPYPISRPYARRAVPGVRPRDISRAIFIPIAVAVVAYELGRIFNI